MYTSYSTCTVLRCLQVLLSEKSKCYSFKILFTAKTAVADAHIVMAYCTHQFAMEFKRHECNNVKQSSASLTQHAVAMMLAYVVVYIFQSLQFQFASLD